MSRTRRNISSASLLFLCAVLALALTAVATPVAAQSKGLAPADLFDLEYAADPQLSPDGQWVAYVRQWSDITTDRRYTNVWIVRTDGTGHRPMTSGKLQENSPRWSPDGKRLAYVSDRSGTPQVWQRFMDTGEMSVLTNLRTPPSALSWSPDGSQIAFVALVPGAPFLVGTPLTPPPGATWAAPPKYDDRLVFRFNDVGEVPRGFSHAFVVRADGGAPRQVTSGDFFHGGQFGGGSLAWTPDGAELIVSARRGENPEFNSRESDLWAFAVTGHAAPRRLTNRFGPDQSPAVSPDGQWIAYVGYNDRHQGFQNTQLSVMKRDGSGARVVSGCSRNSGTGRRQRTSRSPRWGFRR